MKVVIERFKNITSAEISLDNLTLLVGGNNSGKSSILQAIQFAVSVAQTSLSQNAFWKSNRLSTSVSPSDLIYSPLRDVYALSPGGRLRENQDEQIKITFKDETNDCVINVRKGRNKNILIELIGEELGQELQSIDNPFSIIVPGLAGIPNMEEYETPLVVRKAAARGDSNSVFRNILWLLKQDTNNWNEFCERLHDLFPSVNIEIAFDPQRNEHIECFVNLGELRLPIDSCGTGVLQAIQILAYRSLYHPRILILDEPDSHLHPNNQRKLASLLQQLPSNEQQIVISTHSLHLVDALLDFGTTHWVRTGKIVGEAENYELKALIDIGALNEGAELRNAKVIVLAEDNKKNMLECLLAASGFNLDECEVWSYNGCSSVQTAKILIQYIKKHNHECWIVVHRDRDCLTDDEVSSFCQRITEDRVECFVPQNSDLESLFCVPQHVSALYPEVSIEEAQSLWEDVYTRRHSHILEKFVNSRIDFIKKLGEGINAGHIAVECSQRLIENRNKHASGKIMLAGLNEALQTSLGHSANLKRHSDALRQDLLTEIFQKISCGLGELSPEANN